MQNNTENNNHITNQDISDLCTVFAKQIDKIVEQRIAKAEFDKTYYGLISAVYFDNNTNKTSKEYQMYQISYNGYTQDVYIRDGIIHSRGDRVLITLPNGKYKDRYVEVLTKNEFPIKIAYDNDNDKIVETWVNNTGTEITREYILTIKNKGQENEIVTEILLPDGGKIDISEFIVK